MVQLRCSSNDRLMVNPVAGQIWSQVSAARLNTSAWKRYKWRMKFKQARDGSTRPPRRQVRDGQSGQFPLKTPGQRQLLPDRRVSSCNFSLSRSDPDPDQTTVQTNSVFVVDYIHMLNARTRDLAAIQYETSVVAPCFRRHETSLIICPTEQSTKRTLR